MKKTSTITTQRAKMADFKRFAVTLLCVGAFFYLGTILPMNHAEQYTNVYMGASVVFLGLSIFFFTVSKKYKRLLDESDDQDLLQ